MLRHTRPFPLPHSPEHRQHCDFPDKDRTRKVGWELKVIWFSSWVCTLANALMDHPPSHPQSVKVKCSSSKHTELSLLSSIFCQFFKRDGWETKCRRQGGGGHQQETLLSSVGTLPPTSLFGDTCGKNPSALWVTKKESYVLALFATISQEPWLGSDCPGTKGWACTKPAAVGRCGPGREHLHMKLTFFLHTPRSAPACFRSTTRFSK